MTSRPFRNACKDAIQAPVGSDRYLSLFLLVFFAPSLCRSPFVSVLFHVGVRSARAKEDVSSPVVYLRSSRRGNASTPSGDQRESGDSAKPAATRRDQLFPPGMSRRRRREPSTSSAAAPARLFFREFYTSHPEVDTRSRPTPPSLRPIIKPLYPDFAQTGFAGRRCNFPPGVSLMVPR